jgi:DNA ligase-1
MNYETLSNAYLKIESTNGLLDKIATFANVLKSANPEEIGKVVALTRGKLHPDWKGEPEIGIAEKMTIQVVAAAASVPESKVEEGLREHGDIGLIAEELLSQSAQSTLIMRDVTVGLVYSTLDDVSRISGKGSTREKISSLVGILSNASPLEARYVLRTVTGDLRLGLGDMSILDALSQAFTGSREARETLERAYNFSSDLAYVAELLARDGLKAVSSIQPKVGVPIRMMAAKKLSSSSEILEKVDGAALVEFKYDGERIQVHKDGESVTLYSRRQEDITPQYPDVAEMVSENVLAKQCILEGECVAIDSDTGRALPFQTLMRRRRKENIDEYREEIPVAMYFFDVLYVDGRNLTDLPMLERREALKEVINENETVSLTKAKEIDNADTLSQMFQDALDTGNEGLIAKAIHEQSVYQPGARSWLWIKLKASYTEGMSDSVDLVVVGALHGRGKRTGLYGAILASAFDEHTGEFPTVCKIGTGFTDEMLTEFKQRLEEHIISKHDPRVKSDIEADVWIEPALVIEVLGDEVTLSPTHLAGKNRLDDGGLAIRFPRFTGRWRDDKGPKDATTVGELIDMYEMQSRI